MQFLRSGYILTSNEDFATDMANKAKSIVPFSSHKISLDLFNIARIMCPSWVTYIGSVVEEAKHTIQEDNRKNNHAVIIYFDRVCDTLNCFINHE